MKNDYFLKCVIKDFCSNDPRLQSKIMREYIIPKTIKVTIIKRHHLNKLKSTQSVLPKKVP